MVALEKGEDPILLIKNVLFDGVPVRIYQPRAPSAGGRKGIVFFHGGGWATGSIDSYDKLCRCLSKESESVVVSVGYRLAPENHFPAGFEDCLNATIHFLKTVEEHGVDSSSVIICGDSSGGNLTAAVCQALVNRKDLPKALAQILLYPGLQLIDFNVPSYQQNQAIPLLSRYDAVFYMVNYICDDLSMIKHMIDGDHVPANMKLKFRKWLGDDNIPDEFKVRRYKPNTMSSHREDVYNVLRSAFDSNCSPLLADDSVLCRLPKAYILTCEFDVLRDDGILYKKRLEDNGIPVTWYHVKDGYHAIFTFPCDGSFSFESRKTSFDNIVNFIKSA
ncbi:arylacetamide deacetylase-like 4 [Rhinophrynus dorsalis]